MMTRTMSIAPLLAGMLLAAGAAPAAADEVTLEPVPQLMGHFSFSSRSITLKKDGSPDLSVSEIVSPLLLRRPIGRDAEVSLYLSAVAANSDGEKEDSDKSGFNDIEFSGSRSFDAGRYWLGGGIQLPTGSAAVERDQVIVSGVVANRILGMRLKRFGEGLDLFASGVRAFALTRSLVASVGAGYQYKGEYDYREGANDDETVTIKPGDEFYLSAGVDGSADGRSRAFRWKGDVRYRMFMKDERNGEEIYEEGDQVELIASAGFDFGEDRRVDARFFAVVKGDGSEVEGVAEGNIDEISLEEYLQQSLPGGMQQVSVRYGQRVGERFDATGHAVFSNFSEYSFPGEEPAVRLLGSANMLELGAGLVYYIAEKAPVTMRGSFLTGSAEEGAVDMSGFDLVVSFQWIY